MKRATIGLVFALILTSATFADVTVTFKANTAFVPDTLGPTSTVQVRGSAAPLAWGGDSEVFLENVGGDYWMGTVTFPESVRGDTIFYKFYTTAEDTVFAGADWEHTGWEANLGNASTNRELDLVAYSGTDTTLQQQYVNGYMGGAPQYDTPYSETDTTFTLWVRVNMQGWADFSPENMVVGIRGSNMSDWGPTGNISWGETFLLEQEDQHANGGSQAYDATNFYSGPIYVPDQYATAGVSFKPVVHDADHPLDEDWGEMAYNPTVQYEISTSGVDSTVHWKWFDGLEPAGFTGADTVEITFTANLSQASENNGFEIGDTLLVRYGYFGSSAEVLTDTMTRQGFTFNYSTTVEEVPVSLGEPFFYQYYLYKRGQEQREIYYNFEYEGDTPNEAERRMFAIVSGPSVTIEDVEESETSQRRMPLFRNNSLLSQDVDVTVTCDVRPAIYTVLAGSTLFDIQASFDITPAMMEANPDTINEMGVYINGPLSNNGEGTWQTWGVALQNDTTRMMYDDGTHGDVVAGDSIFSITYSLSPDSGHTVGQEFKFGIAGGDNEGGYGNNHVENVDDSQANTILAAQFGSIDPLFYSAWDYDNQEPVAVEEEVSGVAQKFSLGQNYPNPFNPKTTFKYAIPQQADVNIAIYNILGQRVFTHTKSTVAPGTYQFTWNGVDNQNQAVSSGVYFYQIQAGDFSATKKMVLMK